MDLIVRPLKTLSLESSEVEIVERKGLGHPDTICDALAEQLSIALCHFYQERFGLLLHHNVDKVLLWGGIARPAFCGGKVLAPSEIFLAGRATQEFKGVRVPVQELAIESSKNWLRDNFHVLDPEKHVKIHCLVRPGSVDLTELYARSAETNIWLANDTSCGVGFAPLSHLERVVYQGDDGQVGRGNRANGLITPYRPMTLEAAAGKNPVTHVGKLYNVVANLMAEGLVEEIEEVTTAYCYLVSQIGQPVDRPQIVDVQIQMLDNQPIEKFQGRIEEIVRDRLLQINTLWQRLIEREFTLY